MTNRASGWKPSDRPTGEPVEPFFVEQEDPPIYRGVILVLIFTIGITAMCLTIRQAQTAPLLAPSLEAVDREIREACAEFPNLPSCLAMARGARTVW